MWLILLIISGVSASYNISNEPCPTGTVPTENGYAEYSQYNVIY